MIKGTVELLTVGEATGIVNPDYLPGKASGPLPTSRSSMTVPEGKVVIFVCAAGDVVASDFWVSGVVAAMWEAPHTRRLALKTPTNP